MSEVKWADYGESSLTLLAVHCNMDKERPSTPVDLSDFKRCLHLFECLEFGEGEIFSLLCKTADIYPMWKPLKDEWDKLFELYVDENTEYFYKLIRTCNNSVYLDVEDKEMEK